MFTKTGVALGIVLVLVHWLLLWKILSVGRVEFNVYVMMETILLFPIFIFTYYLDFVPKMFNFDINNGHCIGNIYGVALHIIVSMYIFSLGLFLGFLIEKMFLGTDNDDKKYEMGN